MLMLNYHLADEIAVLVEANGCVGPRLTEPAGGPGDVLIMFPAVGHT